MTPAKLSAGLAAAILLAAAPALAQAPRPTEMVALIEGASTTPYTVVGNVKAEHHQTAMFSKVSPREALDKQLREAAARLGADAVVNIKYENNNPMFSKKGFLASGTAVKFTAPVQVAAAPAVVAAPPVAVAAPPPPVFVPAAPVQSVIVPPPAAAAAVAPTTGLIALSEGDITGGRAYNMLGVVTAQAVPNLDRTPRQMLDQDFIAKATSMGADAVIMIRYDATGASAQGVAVKYK